jgi:hypothetical protein
MWNFGPQRLGEFNLCVILLNFSHLFMFVFVTDSFMSLFEKRSAAVVQKKYKSQ